MSRVAIVLSTVLLVCVAGALGYWLGVREGLRVGVMAEWAPRAVVSVAALRSIKSGKTENALVLLESDIDSGLLWSHALSESSIAPLLEPLWGVRAFPADERYVVRLAQYRAQNPSPTQAKELARARDINPEEKLWNDALVRQGQLNDEIIRQMVTRYATP